MIAKALFASSQRLSRVRPYNLPHSGIKRPTAEAIGLKREAWCRIHLHPCSGNHTARKTAKPQVGNFYRAKISVKPLTDS